MEATRMSMGIDIFVINLINIQGFAATVIALLEYHAKPSEFLISKMTQVKPNYTNLIGEHDIMWWKFNKLSQVSSVNHPKKALFRATKTCGNSPKNMA